MSFKDYIKQIKHLNKNESNNLMYNLRHEPALPGMSRLQSAIKKFGIHKFDLKYIKELVEVEPPPDILTELNTDGETPIFEAVKLDNFDLTYFLLTTYPEYTNYLNKYGESLVFELAKENKLESLKIALSVNPNIIYHQNSIGETALFTAIRQKHYNAVYKLVESGSDLLHVRADNLTPIHAIILEDDETLLRILVERFKENLNLVNLADNNNDNLIDFAFSNKKFNCFKYMYSEEKHLFVID